MNRILVYGLSQDTLGGIETFLLSMNKAMSSDTIFDYVIEGTYTIHKDRIDSKGGECYFVSPKKRAIRNLLEWKKLLKKRKSTHKVAYFNLYSLAWIGPIVLAIFAGYKVIVHAHNNRLHDCGVLQKILHSFNRMLQKHLKIYRLCNSDLSSKFFFGKKESLIIYNAVDTQRFAFNRERRDTIRTMYGITEEHHLFGFSGRIAYQKNPLFLIDIFKEISKMDPFAKFIVCGDGDLKESVIQKTKLIGLDVIFADSVANIEDYYSAMDCFILPSRFEGLGIVLIESQTSGLPCFATSTVIPSIVKQTDLLMFVPAKSDARSWSETIIMNTRYDVKRFLYSNYMSQTHFNIAKEAKRLEEILNSLAR